MCHASPQPPGDASLVWSRGKQDARFGESHALCHKPATVRTTLGKVAALAMMPQRNLSTHNADLSADGAASQSYFGLEAVRRLTAVLLVEHY